MEKKRRMLGDDCIHRLFKIIVIAYGCGLAMLASPRLFALCKQSSGGQAEDWPQWRGPNRDGVAEGKKLPNQLPESLRAVWNVEVEEGHSAPVVAGHKVVVFVRQEENELEV